MQWPAESAHHCNENEVSGGVRCVVACDRTTLFVEHVERTTAAGVTVLGEVWIGPVEAGDCFSEVSYWDHADVVSVCVSSISELPDAQEIGRTSRVIAVLNGVGLDRVHPGTVLIGFAPERD